MIGLKPRGLHYDVVAMSFPIVYTNDGDHDPNGLLYTLDAYVPLLHWLRREWEWNDRWLPTAHHRRRRIEMLLDALQRYEEMVTALEESGERPDLLGYVEPPDEDKAEFEHAQRRVHGPPFEIEQNFRHTVDEIAHVLDELTDGEIRRVSRNPAVRAQWVARFGHALELLEKQIADRLLAINARWLAERTGLAAQSGLPLARVDRLMLNDHSDWDAVRASLLQGAPIARYDRVNPLRPVPVVRPLVLRARLGETVTVEVHNQVRDRRVGFHRQGTGLGGGVRSGDGADVGENPNTTIPPGERRRFVWHAAEEGVWLVNDLADIRGTQPGSNGHGLFAAFVVEPPGAVWRDPETGETLTGKRYADGPDVDVIVARENTTDPRHAEFVDFWLDDVPRSFREYTVFFHDEPEIHSAFHVGAVEHSGMPLNYRAEPLPNRVPFQMRRLAERTREADAAGQEIHRLTAVRARINPTTLAEEFRIGRREGGDPKDFLKYLEYVAGEEQHHSAWLFGEPVTPVLRGYAGDPARIRLIHAGVKETHVFHLHVHQWRAVAADTARPSAWQPGEPRGSHLLDSITIGPQTGITVDPLYGVGSRQKTIGDIIWHCHLYPHFHHGMWGLVRSFDLPVDGTRPLPDGTPCHPLRPLPGREPEVPEPPRPGFPWFVDAIYGQKSPPPPAREDRLMDGRRRLLELDPASEDEKAAFVDRPQEGALFVDLDGDAETWNAAVGLPAPRVIHYDIEVTEEPFVYNRRGWRDRHGHFYRVVRATVRPVGSPPKDAVEQTLPKGQPREPLFIRANHGDVVELRLTNLLGSIQEDRFDHSQLPVECGLHVHLVKFDVLAADGSATGWNYLSGASSPEVMKDVKVPAGALPATVSLHRWVVDEEFGPCFFHDHLLANYRQKRGLFAALVAEPPDSRWWSPSDGTSVHHGGDRVLQWTGTEAVIEPGQPSGLPPFREACLAVGDFVPLVDHEGRPLNPPTELSGDDDPGVMAVNYRSEPLTARGPDPAQWFATNERLRQRFREPEQGTEEELARRSWLRDPYTPIFRTHPGERLRIRLIQGSHEEQHSFVTHGLRWRRDWHNRRSPLANQQTLGISEVFTLDVNDAGDTPYGPGDYLYRFSAMDDLWLGCWGLVRALPPGCEPELPPLDPAAPLPQLPPRDRVREYTVRARRVEHPYDGQRLTDPWGLVYEVAEGSDPVFPAGPDGPNEPDWRITRGPRRRAPEPLVLRCHPGEWLKVTLVNEVVLPRREDEPLGRESNGEPVRTPWPGPFEDHWLPRFGPEPDPPMLPLDEKRRVSARVSLHPALLRYDVVRDDGAHVGRNQDGTTAAIDVGGHGGHEGGLVVHGDGHGHGTGNHRIYWWYADEHLAPEGSPGQVCYLHDMADIRNHRHHGLIGAVVVEPSGWTPIDPRTGHVQWTGTNVLLRRGRRTVANEQVLFWQDGLRLYIAGNPDQPVRDVVPDDDAEYEDAGQKGVSYRAAVVHARDGLTDPQPPTPIWVVDQGQRPLLRLVGACDKPRNHTFTVHDQDWQAGPWLREPGGLRSERVGSLSGLTADVAHDIALRVRHAGDHAWRSGVFRWSVQQGMWGVLRVRPRWSLPRPVTVAQATAGVAVGAALGLGTAVWRRTVVQSWLRKR